MGLGLTRLITQAKALARSLIRCSSGISTIEFAIAAPIVILLLMSLMEIGILLTGSIFLEMGVRNASR